jgi:ATPase family associated with various cellular activities (AAA)
MFDFSRVSITTNDYDWSAVAFNNHLMDYFSRHAPENCFSLEIDLDVRVNISGFFQSLHEMAGTDTARYVWWDPHHFMIYKDSLLIYVSGRDRRGDLTSNRVVNNYSVWIYSSKERAEQLAGEIRQKFDSKSYAQVNWFYRGQHGIESRSIFIDNKRSIKDEFYPWFTNGVDTFIKSYLASEAMVLLLYGPPGTGKTSFIKYLLTRHQLHASLTYDDKILQEDHFFIDFLTDDEQDTLIIEDADVLLTDRERDHNSIMSKFLNVSDGIVKMDNKKMIFTTNITQLNSVDDALLRKGRCYAAVEFRRLTGNEARRAGQAAGLTDQDYSARDSWSLAEIFNADTDTVAEAPKYSIGFAPRG